VQVVNGDALEKRRLGQEMVVLLFATVDHIRVIAKSKPGWFRQASTSDSTSPSQGSANLLSTARRPIIQRE